MDQLFGQLVSGSGGSLPTAEALARADAQWIPEIEVLQRNGNLVVQVDLPGVAATDINVEVDDDVLTISGERRDEREVQDGGVRRTERRYGRFARSIALPEGARPEEIRAGFQGGVLEITVPVSQPQSQRRKIDVQSTGQGGGSQNETSHGRSETSSNGGGKR